MAELPCFFCNCSTHLSLPHRCERRDELRSSATDVDRAACRRSRLLRPRDRRLDSRALIELTQLSAIKESRFFSVLISREGRVAYELYTSSPTRDHAPLPNLGHEVGVSALVGIAIDRRLISGAGNFQLEAEI